MCQVQRVINTCGHRNDHVLITCHHAKGLPPSPTPESSPPTLEDKPKSPDSEQSPLARQSQSERHTPQTTSSNDDSPSLSGGGGDGSGDPDMQRAGNPGTAVLGDKIARTGFDARTEPYCVFASVHRLKSPEGFMCMVRACGRAD